MKHLLHFITIIMLSSLLAGCCTRSFCDSDETFYIQFKNFTLPELDSVIITTYEQGSGFTVEKNRFSQHMIADFEYDPGVYTFWQNSNELGFNNDWEIYIPATNSQYRFTNFSLETKKCTKCFFANGKAERYEVLNSYNINDERKDVMKDGNHIYFELYK